MRASFRQAVLIATFLSLVLVEIAGGNLILQDLRTAAIAHINDELAAAARSVGIAYESRRNLASVTAYRLAADQDLSRAVARNDIAQITHRLEGLIDPGNRQFLLLIDKLGGLVAQVGVSTPLLAANEASARIDEALGDPAAGAILRDGEQVFQLSAVASPNKSWTIIAGFAVTADLVAELVARPGIEVSMGASVPAGAHVAARTVALAGSHGPHVRLLVPEEKGLAGYHQARARMLFIGPLLLLAAMVVIGVLTKWWAVQKIERPLGELLEAIYRVHKGLYTRPLRLSSNTKFARIAVAFNDMQMEIAEREARVDRHGEIDNLTGLTSRAVVTEKLERAVSRASETKGSVAVAAIDLSRFNQINDAMGHKVGDQVLQEVARRLASDTRVSDTVARVGGDEFVVVLDHVDSEMAGKLVELLAASLEAPVHVGEFEVNLKVRLGVAMFPDHCDSAAGLLRLSSIALYAAKDANQRIVIFESGQDERHLRELAIIHDLPGAIADGQLYMQYQPKIDIDTQEVRSVEALVRWRHPQLGYIPPDEFVTLLEKAGKISLLTEWVIEAAVRQCREWDSAGFPIGVAINISAHDLMDETLPERIRARLRHHMVDPKQICVEVTESAMMRDPEASIRVLNRLKKTGIGISLDDFGTGQTSLALLKQLPLDQLKIDKSFVQTLRADSGDAIIVKSIIDLGHNMGLVVVAEGVESNYCWNLLNSYGCDSVQGYLVSPPVAPEELNAWYLRLQRRHLSRIDYGFMENISA